MPDAQPITRYRLSVEDFHRMGEAGIFREDDHIELIDGELIEMTPIGSRHAAMVGRLTRALVSLVQDRAIVWVQNPLRLERDSEPEPDLALLRPRADYYEQRLPSAVDVLWLIEVMDTSQGYDREVKIPLYARHGIPEVWLVDLPLERLEMYRKPAGNSYLQVDILTSGALCPVELPDVSLSLASFWGR